MKIYVFTFHTAKNGEFLCAESRVYKSEEEAMEVFNEWKREEKQWADEDGWSIDHNDETYFEASKGFDYCNNHTEGFVEEFEV